MTITPRLPVLPQRELESCNGFPRYSAAEMSRRWSLADAAMEASDVDAIVVVGATTGLETAVQYFSNWAPLVESYLILPRGGEAVLFARLWNHVPDAELIATVDDVRYGGDSPVEQAMNAAALLGSLGLGTGRIGVIGPLRAADQEILGRELPSARWVDLNGRYREMRLVKSEEEMVYMRIASAFNDRSIDAMQRLIRPGMREYEVNRIIEEVYLAERGTNLIHFTMSTSMAEPDRCVPHQQQPDRVIREGDVVVTEISTTFWGYAGQVLRSFTVAAEPTPLFQDLFDVATDAYESITAALRTGVTVGEILELANGIDAAGFTILDDLVHGQGGTYLPPIIRTRQSRGATHPDDYGYPSGSVVVVQPNVVTPDGRAGVQLGNALRITDDGAELLQDAPMAFLRCG
jgi:Xaa-Pro dipeptidase